MAKKAKPRKKYTQAQRDKILATAKREKLTAEQVRKRFGVIPITYYSWRKKYGVAKRRGTISAKTTREIHKAMEPAAPKTATEAVRSWLDEGIEAVDRTWHDLGTTLITLRRMRGDFNQKS